MIYFLNLNKFILFILLKPRLGGNSFIVIKIYYKRVEIYNKITHITFLEESLLFLADSKVKKLCYSIFTVFR